MTRKEKIELIDKNSDLFISMLDDFIKSMQYLIDTLLIQDDNGKYIANPLIQNANKDDKAMKVLISMTKELKSYQNIRDRLLNGDIDFTPEEINYIAFGCKHTIEVINKQIETLNEAKEFCKNSYAKLVAPEY